MLIFNQSKKGIAPIFIILIIIFVLLAIYLFLYIPIPAFKSLRTLINYFLILIFWIAFQIGLIFAYYEVGKYIYKGIIILKTKVVNWSMDIRHLIIRQG